MPAIWTYLHRPDGSVIASTSWGFAPGARWSWIAAQYAEDAGCTPDEVSVLETEDGDLITVRGEPAGYVINEVTRATIREDAL